MNCRKRKDFNRLTRSLAFFMFVIFSLLFVLACDSKKPAFKHVIFFIGDGMSVESQVAASRYLYGTDNGLVWHSFPGRAFVATWDVTSYNSRARQARKPAFNSKVINPAFGYNVKVEGRSPLNIKIAHHSLSLFLPATDSASAASAMATGFKTDSGNIAWLPGDPPGGHLPTIMEEFRAVIGGSIGIVTTVPFNHATPAAFVAHNVSRSNYYTGYRGYNGLGIADEIILRTKPEVVIGGGHPVLDNPDYDPGKGYISKELIENLRNSSEYIFVERQLGKSGSKSIFLAAEVARGQNKKLFGLFGGEGGNFETPEPEDKPGFPAVRRIQEENPTLAESVLAALKVLSANQKGFFLMVEQGDIDWASHDHDFRRMIGCLIDLEEAVKTAVSFVSQPGDSIDWDNTVFIVTADHATGGLRLNPGKPLGKGDLPVQKPRNERDSAPFVQGSDRISTIPENVKAIMHNSPYFYPDGEVVFYSAGHSNDLVTLSVNMPAYNAFLKYKGLWYPGPIIDNTHINAALRDLLGLKPVK